MTISFVGAQGNAGTTVTIPTHQSGDLILIFAYRDGNATAPATPAASGTVPTWTLIGSGGANQNSSNFRYAVATASTTTSGTWTNASELICLVYRGTKLVGTSAGDGASSTTIAYPALSLNRTDGSSWVVGVAGHRSATNVEGAPSGMTNRAFTGTEAAGHDTNGTVSSWSQQTVSVSANGGWRSWTVELRDATATLLADTRSYALTGAGANLNRGYKLSADAGSFALTGAAVTERRGYRESAGAGTWTLTGSDALLERAWVLPGDSGAYGLAGGPAGFSLASGLTFDADPGPFQLAGGAATLHWRTTASSGALALGGAAVRIQLTLAAPPATWGLAGGDVNLGVRVTFATQSASFQLGGGTTGRSLRFLAGGSSYGLDAAAVRLNLSQPAASGAFQFSAAPAALGRNTALVTTTGALQLQGGSLVLSNSLALEGGSLSWGAAPAILRLQVPLPAASWSLSGSAITPRRGFRLDAGPAAITAVAAAAELLGQWQLAAAEGAWGVGGSAAALGKGTTVMAAAASLQLAGGFALLPVQRRIGVDSGALVLAGSAALQRQLRLVAANTVFVLAGAVLASRLRRYLGAEFASFNWAFGRAIVFATQFPRPGVRSRISGPYGGSDRTDPSFLRPPYVRFNAVSKSRDLGRTEILEAELSGLVGSQSGTNTLYFKVSLPRPLELRIRVRQGAVTDRYLSVGILDANRAPLPLSPDGRAQPPQVYGQAGDQSPVPAGDYYFTVSTHQWQAIPFVVQAFVGRYALLTGTALGRLEPQGRLPLAKLRGAGTGTAPLLGALLRPATLRALATASTSGGQALPSLQLAILRGTAVGQMLPSGRLKMTWRLTGTAGGSASPTASLSSQAGGGGYGY